MSELGLEGISASTAAAVAARRRRRLVRWTVVAAAILALLGLGFFLSDVTNPLLVGLLLAYVLNPLVEALERRGLSRDRSVVILFGVVLLATTGLLGFAALKAADGLQELRHAVAGEPLLDPKDLDDARRMVQGLDKVVRSDPDHAFIDEDGDGQRRVGLAEKATVFASDRLGARLSRQDLLAMARAYQSQVASVLLAGVELSHTLRRSLGQVGTFFGYVLLVPLYTFFLLRSFSSLRDTVRDHLPGAYRARVVEVARKIDRQVAAFFRGRLVLALIKGLATWFGLWLAGVPFSFAIGMGAGALSVVPFLGPVCGIVLAAVLVFEGPGSYAGRLLMVALAFGAAEVVEAVAQPLILGREVGLSPLAIILSFFVFGRLLGFFGVLLAVPIACVVKVLFEELVLPEVRALAEEPGPPVPPEPEPVAAPPPAAPATPATAAGPPPAPPVG